MRAGAPLRRVRLADEDRARLAQARDLQGVGLGHVLAVGRRAVGRAHAGGVLQILVRDRQAVQRRQVVAARAAAVGLVGRRERALGRPRHDRVDERVDALDPRKVRLDELARRERAGAQRAGLLGRAQEAEVVGAAAALSAPALEPGVGDARDVADVGAAAAAEDREVRQRARAAPRDARRDRPGSPSSSSSASSSSAWLRVEAFARRPRIRSSQAPASSSAAAKCVGWAQLIM